MGKLVNLGVKRLHLGTICKNAIKSAVFRGLRSIADQSLSELRSAALAKTFSWTRESETNFRDQFGVSPLPLAVPYSASLTSVEEETDNSLNIRVTTSPGNVGGVDAATLSRTLEYGTSKIAAHPHWRQTATNIRARNRSNLSVIGKSAVEELRHGISSQAV